MLRGKVGSLYRTRGPLSYCTIFVQVFLVPVIFFSALSAEASTVLNISNDRHSYDFPGHLEVFLDETGKFTIEKVSSPEMASSFKPIPGNLTGGFTDGAYWLRFTVQKTQGAPHEWWLEAGPPFLDRLDLYESIEEGPPYYRQRSAGAIMTKALREVDHNQFVFILDLPDDLPRTYYIRLQTTSSAYLNLTLWRPHEFIEAASIKSLLLGAFYGTMILICIVCPFYWFLTKDVYYLGFMAYVVALTFSFLNVNGYAYRFFLPYYPPIAPYFNGLVTFLAIVIFSFFFSRLLRINVYFPRLQKFFDVCGVLAIISIGFVFAGRYNLVAPKMQLLVVLQTLIMQVASIIIARRGYKPAWLLSIAFSITTAAFMMNVLRNLGLISHSFITNWVFQISALTYAVSILMAMAMKIRITEHEKSEAQQQALDIALKAEKELESKVEERTSELNAAKDAAEDAARVKSDFLAKMSHEIRTPLNAISGFTSLALQKKHDCMHREYLENINASSGLLLNLVNDILDFSKIEAGKLQIVSSDFRPRETLKRVVNVLSPLVSAKGLKLTRNVAEDVPEYLSGDPARLKQVLLNLISNAVKFTEHGDINICVRRISPDGISPVILEFSVSDTGIGISEEEMPALFEPFSQIGDALSRRYEGAGLGLAISRDIVKMMGGDIAVKSVEGEGSVFMFTAAFMPVAAKVAEKVALPDEACRALPVGGKILIVEDNKLNRQVAAGFLALAGIAADEAENGQEALNKLISSADTYDAVLMDISMPGMDGFETTKAIRAYERFKNIPIIAVTALALEGDREKCLKAGMDDYISKPLDESELYNVLSRWVKSSPLCAEAGQALSGTRESGGNIRAIALKIFVEDYGPAVEGIREKLKTGDMDGAIRAAHSLKGAALQIEAERLHRVAGALEAALKAGNVTDGLLDEASAALAEALETARRVIVCPRSESE
ncbi:MAG: response regulator [Nitrospirae bacterium]|nr:MAG: response regulator [Nitrospirota bacterium]